MRPLTTELAVGAVTCTPSESPILKAYSGQLLRGASVRVQEHPQTTYTRTDL